MSPKPVNIVAFLFVRLELGAVSRSMAQPKRPMRRTNALPIVVAIVAAVALILAMQGTFAAQIGAVLANVLVTVVAAVTGLLGAVLG